MGEKNYLPDFRPLSERGILHQGNSTGIDCDLPAVANPMADSAFPFTHKIEAFSEQRRRPEHPSRTLHLFSLFRIKRRRPCGAGDPSGESFRFLKFPVQTSPFDRWRFYLFRLGISFGTDASDLQGRQLPWAGCQYSQSREFSFIK
jgi:hypothetical protein